MNYEAELFVQESGETPPVLLDRISILATYGPGVAHPFRFRAGLGWFPERPFTRQLGTEIVILERLNSSEARFLGLYAFLDGVLEFYQGLAPDFYTGIGFLFPLTNLGGVLASFGTTRSLRPNFRLGYAWGAYPLVPVQNAGRR